MPCFSPFLRKLDHIDRYGEKHYKMICDPTPAQIDLAWSNRDLYQIVPCKHCVGCRLAYSRQWSIRCVLESLQWSDNYFLTLTYDDEHLPCLRVDLSTGELITQVGAMSETDVSTLVLKDMQDFNKRLREYWSRVYNHDNIRIYYVGEYGTLRERAHYHGIYFNLPLPDLQIAPDNKRGQRLYCSATIDRLWGKGRVRIGACTYQSAGYVARYIMKKVNGPVAEDHYKGRLPEFAKQPRRPGLARSYFDENSGEIYDCDQITICAGDGKAISLHPPEYFDILYGEIDPDRLDQLKEDREDVQHILTDAVLERTDKTYSEYLAVQRSNLLVKIRALKRVLD